MKKGSLSGSSVPINTKTDTREKEYRLDTQFIIEDITKIVSTITERALVGQLRLMREKIRRAHTERLLD